MMKKYRLLYILMLCALMPFGARALTANEAMAKIVAKINASPAMTVHFVATADNGQTADGVLVMGGDKFAITSAGYSAWFNGKDMWSLYHNSDEVSLTEPTQEELMEINPFVIINNYARAYKAAMVSQASGSCTIRLTPLSAMSQVKTATVTIDTNTWMPKSLDATFANGQSLAIAIKGVSVGQQTPPAAAFTFPSGDYPDVEIIDLRY